MLDLYSWPAPNGHKVQILVEELGIPYRLIPIDITRGAQREASYRAINPNARIPAIVDHAPLDGGEPITVFESGAVMLYLAEKAGRFIPTDPRRRIEVLQWLFWQMAGLGPMTGQYGHFHVYAPEDIAYAKDRYRKEAERLLGVLDTQLEGRAFIAGDAYSIADMACYPWISPYDKAPLDLAPFTNVRRWQAAIRARPATKRAYALTKQVSPDAGKPMSDEQKKILFGQGAR